MLPLASATPLEYPSGGETLASTTGTTNEAVS